ncbi:MAG: UDP-2,3-diacylglucosamine diphosphatase [Cyclobacteriaceae bacterium]|nr:UDP-2,3-diacylglucosamine diphosphatase [Cyclobacteriaceae bacterium]
MNIELKKNKKIYFASDFHLGLPAFPREQEIDREQKIIRWLDSIENNAQAIFLIGDIFDFWFEYKHVVPKGFIRFLGKIASLIDHGIPVYFFTGNHDVWMFRYFQEELGVEVYEKPTEFSINNTSFLIAHGDGLGPGDAFYKILKKIFTNKFTQWVFSWIHPDIGIGLGRRWSKSSRIRKLGSDEEFLGEKEFLVQFCKKVELEKHHDFYVFGHRHLPLDVDINDSSKYYNLGEWVHHFSFGEFDGETFRLKTFEDES